MKQYDKSECRFKLVLDYCFFDWNSKVGSCFFPLERPETLPRRTVELPPNSYVRDVEKEIRKLAIDLCI